MRYIKLPENGGRLYCCYTCHRTQKQSSLKYGKYCWYCNKFKGLHHTTVILNTYIRVTTKKRIKEKPSELRTYIKIYKNGVSRYKSELGQMRKHNYRLALIR